MKLSRQNKATRATVESALVNVEFFIDPSKHAASAFLPEEREAIARAHEAVQSAIAMMQNLPLWEEVCAMSPAQLDLQIREAGLSAKFENVWKYIHRDEPRRVRRAWWRRVRGVGRVGQVGQVGRVGRFGKMHVKGAAEIADYRAMAEQEADYSPCDRQAESISNSGIQSNVQQSS